MRTCALTIPLTLSILLGWLAPCEAQTIFVTTSADIVDVDWQTATVDDLPGPDGLVSFSEAMIASDHTPGRQTIGFHIPQSDWQLQFAYPGRAVLTVLTGFFLNADDAVTIDGTTQTAFTGNTHPGGNEVVLYGAELQLNADDCSLFGFDSSSVAVNGSNGLVQGNTSMNISVFGGSGSRIEGNTGGTIKIDRSNDNIVVGNTVQRVRVLGFAPSQFAIDNQIGGPLLADRNWITGYGTYNSEGLPAGTTIQLFDSRGTVIENNWIGTTPDGLAQGNLASTMGIGFEGTNHDTTIRDNRIAGILGHGIGPHHAGQLFGWAILIGGAGSGITIAGNTIGLDANDAPLLGSVFGIDVGDSRFSTVTDIQIGGPLPGEGNVVAGHLLNGITVASNVPQVRIRGTTFHENGWLGIDLIPTSFGYGVSPNDSLDQDSGGNGLQNFPVIHAVLREGTDVRVRGELHSSATDDFTLEFFASAGCDASGFGEGQVFLGATSVTTDSSGDAAFDVLLPGPLAAGWVMSSTATLELLGATSEFSACAPTVWFNEGSALPGISGDPLLVGTGDLTAASANSIELSSARPAALCGVFVALSGGAVPFRGGTLRPTPLVGSPLLRFTADDGSVSLPFVMPPSVAPGTELWIQFAIVDDVAIRGMALSNALMGVTP